jgi:hypothetical protein
VSGTGVVTGIAVGGPVTITATSEGQSGTGAITIMPAPVASVSVTPAAASLTAGFTQQLAATPKDAAGNALTGRTVTWASSNVGVASVGAAGLVTGSAVGGPVTITATSEGHSGSAAITVTPVPVASVSLNPATASITTGLTQQFTAIPKDAAGNALSGRAVTWSSSDVGVAPVSATGLATGVAAGGPVTISATSEGRSGTATITVTASAGNGPLRRGNSPYFFTDGTGRAVLLVGSHTWMNFQDASFTDPPPAFNWPGYLDFFEQHHHNFIRLWRWEQASGSTDTPTPNDLWFAPMPYLRSGPGTARDGKPKFNLTQFNPAYFARMRQRILDAGQRGIYVSIMLFDGWSIEDKSGAGNPWLGHPLHRDNNSNGIDGDPNYDGQGLETHTLQIPAIVALQEAYVRQVVDAVNDLDNVLYEISNESRLGAEAWQGHMIAYIKQYEASKPKQHPVGMTALYPGGNNADLLASAADWISPNGSMTNPPAADGRKVILNDSDHLCGTCSVEPWVWESLTRGLNPISMDPYDGAFPTATQYNLSDPAWELVRRNLGYARTYATRMNLAAMQPRGDLASSGYCIAHVGREYLVYLPPETNGSVTVDLSGATSPLTVEWFDPSTGQTTTGGTTPGGTARSFSAPTSGDAVLYLH